MSLKVVPFKSLGVVSYSPSIVTFTFTFTFTLNVICVNIVKEKQTDIFCTAPHSKKLISEALRCGSHYTLHFHTTNTPHLPLPSKRLPDGATNSDNSHLITAYYSFIYYNYN